MSRKDPRPNLSIKSLKTRFTRRNGRGGHRVQSSVVQSGKHQVKLGGVRLQAGTWSRLRKRNRGTDVPSFPPLPLLLAACPSCLPAGLKKLVFPSSFAPPPRKIFRNFRPSLLPLNGVAAAGGGDSVGERGGERERRGRRLWWRGALARERARRAPFSLFFGSWHCMFLDAATH